MEEDFGPKNNDWYNVAKKKLSNVVYVGESNIGRIKKGNDDNRLTNPIYRNTWHAAKQEVMDGWWILLFNG